VRSFILILAYCDSTYSVENVSSIIRKTNNDFSKHTRHRGNNWLFANRCCHGRSHLSIPPYIIQAGEFYTARISRSILANRRLDIDCHLPVFRIHRCWIDIQPYITPMISDMCI